ncbi:hypothetical protein PFICI_06352 [Pestalotiopsis fici W106-1]|uniref:Uncharacterized protein n=1 Tax=Pestalotiopsis fici (strain W106-1 / CGMCC3.15140) TaxID=1229662 RepID=W3X5M3_PESFW|nr:uncharacterized protein PFICI_06352 [Pestalotiopsis fici W106-1]ETS81350.1 hypothetical protein PFICI_06352 [Pestalotiopsis fici W106-1]
MAIVAVAGGTGAVGRTLEANISAQSRVQHLCVNYSNVDQISSTLRENDIQVVVSALVLLDEKTSDSQINLIRASAQSGTVSKFIPSEYHLDFHVPIQGIELSFKSYQLRSEEELERHPQLTWTLIRNGLFLDYLAMPFHPKPTNLMPWSIFVDLQHEICVLPGDGTQMMVFTHSADLAAIVERLIDIPGDRWPRESLIEGNKFQLKDLIQILERVTGKSFTVIYDSVEDIQRGQITQLPSNRDLFAQEQWGNLYQLVEKEAMFTLLSDGYNLGGESLMDMFPEVQITRIETFLRDAWTCKSQADPKQSCI